MCAEQGAQGVIDDLRDWCDREGGPMALGVVSWSMLWSFTGDNMVF